MIKNDEKILDRWLSYLDKEKRELVDRYLISLSMIYGFKYEVSYENIVVDNKIFFSVIDFCWIWFDSGCFCHDIVLMKNGKIGMFYRNDVTPRSLYLIDGYEKDIFDGILLGDVDKHDCNKKREINKNFNFLKIVTEVEIRSGKV